MLMKKISLFIVSLLLSVVSMAAELNIYASGLQAGTPDASNKVQINYVLNAPATALEVQLKLGDVVTNTFAITDAGLLTKGAHTATVDMNTAPAGTYTWAIKATAAATSSTTLTTGDETRFNFYTPTGLAVDNSFESPFFGRIYVVESREGLATTAGRVTHEGVYILSPTLQDVTEQGNNSYGGGVTWVEGSGKSDASGFTYDMYGPARLAIAEDGYVFVSDNGRVSATANYTGVWMMDPANPSANFKEVLDRTKIGTTFDRVNSIAASGKGANRVLYVEDYSDYLKSFPVGTCETPYSGAGTTLITTKDYNIANALNTIIRGKDGDFWVFQFRASLDTYPCVTHFNAAGERDFYISSEKNSSLAPASFPCRRGIGTVSPDGSKLAFNGNGKIYIYDVAYDTDGVPSLSNLINITSGNNVDAMAFDVAGNFYYASASTEWFRAYALPKTDNNFTTPAPTANTITIVSTGNHVSWVLNGGYYFPYASKEAMYQDLAADVYASRDVCTGWLFASSFKGTFGAPDVNGGTGVAFDIQEFDMSFLTTEPYATKWGWLKNYLDAQCSAQSKTAASSGQAYFRYNLAAFFANSARTSAYPISADYAEAGKIENWIANFNNGEAYPTEVTTTYTIPAPFKPFHTFAGWYDNASFTGTAITSLDNTYNGMIYANYTPIAVTGIALNKSSETIVVGANTALVATIAPADALNQNVIWTSSDEAVATVANGVVTGVAGGNATITAKSEDGEFTATCTITVTANEVTWVLNGGIYLPYANKDELVADFTNDYNTVNSASINWSSATATDIWSNSWSNEATKMKNIFVTNTELAAKWAWLKDYLESVATAQNLTEAATGIHNGVDQWLRSAVAGFLTNSLCEGGNVYPGADYTEAGLYDNWAGEYSGTTYPKYISGTYVIPTPYRADYEFLGWYDNAGFSGTAITSVDGTFDGTLYAAWAKNPTTLAEAVVGKTIRRSVFNNGYLYVLLVNAQKNPYLYKVDPETGNIVTRISTDICSVKGTNELCYKLSDIQFTEDNVLIGCNAEQVNVGGVVVNHWLIYKWTEVDGVLTPAVWIEANKTNIAIAGNWTNGIMGTTFAYTGTSVEGCIFGSALSTALSNVRVVTYIVKDGAFNDWWRNNSGYSCTELNNDFYFLASPNASNFIVDATTIAPEEWSYVEGSVAEGIATATISKASTATIAANADRATVLVDGCKTYMLTCDAEGVYVYDITTSLAAAEAVNTEDNLEDANTATFRAAFGAHDGLNLNVYFQTDGTITKMVVPGFFPSQWATSLEDINMDVNVQKVIRDGKIYIIRNGVTYTTTGQVVE